MKENDGPLQEFTFTRPRKAVEYITVRATDKAQAYELAESYADPNNKRLEAKSLVEISESSEAFVWLKKI